jgi:hypothetical protein
MTRGFQAALRAVARISGAGAVWRRLGAWAGKIAAALKDPELLSPEDYERELRERVFHPPQA